MKRRILPQPQVHPLHRVELLALAAVIVLFSLLGLTLLLSRLHPTAITAKAPEETATRVFVKPAPPHQCNFTLEPGTRIASFPCLPYETSRSELFANLSHNGSTVLAMYRYLPSRGGRWEAYNASLPNYTVQLGTFLRHEALYLVLNGSEDFAYQGVLPNPANVQMRRGWNLVGYVQNGTRTLPEALTTLNDTYTEVRALEGTEQSGTYLVYRAGGGTLGNMTFATGYWINLTAADTWVVT